MKISRSAIKLYSGIITAALLLIFFRSNSDTLSPMQREYDAWVTKFIDSSLTTTVTSDLPKLSLQLPRFGAPSGDHLGDRHLELSASKDKIFRLLELAKEARLFDLQNKSTRSDNEIVSFTVERDGKIFRSEFSVTSSEESTKVALFLKLFQLFGVERPTLAMNKEGNAGAVTK